MVAHAFKPLIPVLGRQRQADLSEFEASLVYKVSCRTVNIVTQRNPVSNPTPQKKETVDTTNTLTEGGVRKQTEEERNKRPKERCISQQQERLSWSAEDRTWGQQI